MSVGGAIEVCGSMVDTDLYMKRVRWCSTNCDRALRVNTGGDVYDLVYEVVIQAPRSATGVKTELDG